MIFVGAIKFLFRFGLEIILEWIKYLKIRDKRKMKLVRKIALNKLGIKNYLEHKKRKIQKKGRFNEYLSNW
jgi:hypothetical protein